MVKPTLVLLRSSWATVNIGDVAHSPGVIEALRRHGDQGDGHGVEVVLWPVRLGQRERVMLERAHPGLRWVEGEIVDGEPDNPQLAAVLDEADVLVHGSGAGVFVRNDLRWWRLHRRAPYGFFGITVDPLSPPTVGRLDELRRMVGALPSTFLDPDLRELLDEAAFVFCRDTITLEFLRSQRVAARVIAFGPDGTFAYTSTDEAAGQRFLAGHRLRPQQFACFVPRLRYAPYAAIYGGTPTLEQQRRDAVNAGTVHDDLRVLVAAIEAWVTRSGRPAVVVPEMSYAVQMAQELLPELLPAQVAPHVQILDRYWSLDEATAVYRRSAAVVSMECHSPILASAWAVPTVYLRQPSETFKSAMYEDLGHPEMVIEIDSSDAIERAQKAVVDIVDHPETASARSRALNNRAGDHLATMAGVVVAAAELQMAVGVHRD